MSIARPLAAALLLAIAAAPAGARGPYDDVDPFIGTGGEGHTFPGAVAPFGMVQVSPDTDTRCRIRDCYGHAAGYRHDGGDGQKGDDQQGPGELHQDILPRPSSPWRAN